MGAQVANASRFGTLCYVDPVGDDGMLIDEGTHAGVCAIATFEPVDAWMHSERHVDKALVMLRAGMNPCRVQGRDQLRTPDDRLLSALHPTY